MARQQTNNPTQSATQSATQPQQYQQEPSQQTPPSQQASQQQQQQSSQSQPQPGRGAASGGPSGADRERQRAVTREGAPGSTPGSAPGTGVQRGERTGMATTGLGAPSPSLLPAFMARPDLMAGAFMSNPFAFAQAMSQEMDRLFGLASGESMSPYDRTGAGPAGRSLAAGRPQGVQGYQGYPGATQRWAPQLEVFQRGNELVVRADLPGMRPDDVQIDVEDGVLTISGERREENEERERGFYRSERSYGAFSRSIALPDDVDEERVQARYEHGVLEVTVPMPQPQARRGRRVEIQSGASGSVAGTRSASGASTEGARGTGTEGTRPEGTRSEGGRTNA